MNYQQPLGNNHQLSPQPGNYQFQPQQPAYYNGQQPAPPQLQNQGYMIAQPQSQGYNTTPDQWTGRNPVKKKSGFALFFLLLLSLVGLFMVITVSGVILYNTVQPEKLSFTDIRQHILSVVPLLKIEIRDEKKEQQLALKRKELERQLSQRKNKRAYVPAKKSSMISRKRIQKTVHSYGPDQRGINYIDLTSTPSGAALKVNGNLIGHTPYRWDNPSMYGDLVIEASFPGYAHTTRRINYGGGAEQEHIFLQEQSSVTHKKSFPAPQMEQIAQSPVQYASRAEVTPHSIEAGSDGHTSVIKSKTHGVSQPVASSPAKHSTDWQKTHKGVATIFISSLPPVADVFRDGKMIGKTNRKKLDLTPGQHTLTFIKGSKETTKVIMLSEGENPSLLIRF